MVEKAIKKTEENAPQTETTKARRGRWIAPPVTVYEADEHVIVELEMPGVEKDKIEVTVERDELTVVGWRKTEAENIEILHRERPTGGYRRSFVLGESIDSSKISAVYENGVLRLTLGKAEAAKPKRIAVN